MAVSGFGANSGEIKDQKVIPDKLLVYRRFRFRPGHIGGKAEYLWANFMNHPEVGYRPCLSAASYVDVFYDRPGVYTAMCHRHQMRAVRVVLSMLADQSGEKALAHTAPDKDCQCGFWSYFTPEVVDTGNGEDWTALAAVKVWGDVVLGELGVRAQKMEIVALQPPMELATADRRIVEAWQELTGKLKVPSFWAKADLLTFFPPQDVSELIPQPEPAPPYPFDDVMTMKYRTSGWQNPLWQYQQQHQLWAANPPTPRTYYSYTTGAQTTTTYYENRCCVCGYTLVAQTQADLDASLYKHMMEKHP